MKIRKISLLALAAMSMMAIGCKDDSTATIPPNLSGYVDLWVEPFVEMGHKVTYKLDEISFLKREDNADNIGYFFTLPVSDKRDTVRFADGKGFIVPTYTFTAPDTLGHFTLSYTGFSQDYSNTRGYIAFDVVKPGLNGDASITNFDISSGEKSFVDERDGKMYYYTTVDGVDWMRQNLAWEGAGVAYMECEVMTDILGRYYTHDEAVSACPDGWRLPSDEEWVALAKAFGAKGEAGDDLSNAAGPLMENVYFNGERLWEYWRNVKITNEARVSLLPAGYGVALGDGYDFQGFKAYASFWNSGKDEEGMGTFRYIYMEQDDFFEGKADPMTMVMPVRCIR